MSKYQEVQTALAQRPQAWLVTGVAGFIGSNLLEQLLRLGQQVVGLDNFSSGTRSNLAAVQAKVAAESWARFRLIEGDLGDLAACAAACQGADFVVHQAGLGSVPRSLEDPLRSHASNVDGFLNLLVAARDAGVQRFVYASSSSVYGDHPDLPKIESRIGRPLSPYAATKLIDEIYAAVFERCYGLPTTGLRYFNVFGPRQDPAGPYAAVIPIWFNALRHGLPVAINGDGLASRDFCFVSNVVQANILAALESRKNGPSETYNVACGHRTTLLELFARIREIVALRLPAVATREPIFRSERPGDVRHSLADVGRARGRLGYEPSHTLEDGLREACAWYFTQA